MVYSKGVTVYHTVADKQLRDCVFIDCGSHKLEALGDPRIKSLLKSVSVLEFFEPNPIFDLSDYRSKVSSFGIPERATIKINQKAVWIYDGQVEFSQEFINDRHNTPMDRLPKFKTGEPPSGEGSSITSVSEELSDRFCFAEPILVECVDFSRLLESYANYKTIVKMDIEGSEYTVLRHAIERDTAKYIDELYIEWHHPSTKDEDEESTRIIAQDLQNAGVKTHDWN